MVTPGPRGDARGGRLPRRVPTAMIALCLIAARFVLARAGDASHVALVAGGALELAAIALIVVRARRVRRAWRAARARGESAGDALDLALAGSGLPERVATMIATELTIVGYAIAGWRSPIASDARFTVHRANGWTSYLGVFLFLLVVESAVVHLLLAVLVSATAAWIASALAAYSMLWLVGDAHALRHTGVTLAADALDIRIGVRWRGRIAWSEIATIERGETPGNGVDASVLGGNVVLRLRAPRELRGPLGRRRRGDAIALSIDDPDRFVIAARAQCADRVHRSLCGIG